MECSKIIGNGGASGGGGTIAGINGGQVNNYEVGDLTDEGGGLWSKEVTIPASFTYTIVDIELSFDSGVTYIFGDANTITRQDSTTLYIDVIAGATITNLRVKTIGMV